MIEKNDIMQTNIDTSFLAEVKNIVEQGRQQAYASVSQLMIETYWKIGERIVSQEQKGANRAEYGAQLIAQLSEELTRAYGKGFSGRYLRAFRQFYLVVPDLEIWKSRFPNLTWTHILKTLRVTDTTAVRWYLSTASQEMWSVRTLDRNISMQYYERHFKQPQLSGNEAETTIPDKLELLKSPIVAEFLGFNKDDSYSETELESAVITHLQDFIMELGRGFAFMGRQELIRTRNCRYMMQFYREYNQELTFVKRPVSQMNTQ